MLQKNPNANEDEYSIFAYSNLFFIKNNHDLSYLYSVRFLILYHCFFKIYLGDMFNPLSHELSARSL